MAVRARRSHFVLPEPQRVIPDWISQELWGRISTLNRRVLKLRQTWLALGIANRPAAKTRRA
jgi:hypothetical protein